VPLMLVSIDVHLCGFHLEYIASDSAWKYLFADALHVTMFISCECRAFWATEFVCSVLSFHCFYFMTYMYFYFWFCFAFTALKLSAGKVAIKQLCICLCWTLYECGDLYSVRSCTNLIS